jgi:hypothetical protein
MIAPDDMPRLEALLRTTEYPGNHAIPEPGEDYYLFAGEIGWSRKYGRWLRRKNGTAKPQLGEAFSRTEQKETEKRYCELTRREKTAVAYSGFLSNAYERVSGDDLPLPGKIPASQIVRVPSWVQIPGVSLELPSYRFSWESYHSEENRSGNPDYPAPSLVECLGLRKTGAQVDLLEESGRLATVYREFGRQADGLRSDLLYLRSDLVKKYLDRTGRMLVWINWGERGLHYSAPEKDRESPALRAVWDTHAHIHRQFVIYKPAAPQFRLPTGRP